MALETNDQEMQRKFSYVQIQWEIENYFSASCKEKWFISSPEFSITGYRTTKWRLFLKSTRPDDKGEYGAAIGIERLESDPFPKLVRVNWNLWYPCGTDNIIICKRDSAFEKQSSFYTRIKTMKLLENRLSLISTDKLCFGGLIIVHCPEDTTLFRRPTDQGLKNLSQDIGVLSKLKLHNDVTLFTANGSSIMGHKAILSARSKVIQNAMENSNEEDEIDLDTCNGKCIHLILDYLYSGNLGYVLRWPIIAMDETIKFLDLVELAKFFERDELTLYTKFVPTKLSFKWLITDFDFKKGNSFLSPQFSDENLNFTFQLRVCIHENNEYMGIYLEAVEGTEPEELFIKFDIIDMFGSSVHCKSLRWALEDGKEIKIEDLVTVDSLKSPELTENGKLCILCRLCIPSGSALQSVVINKTCSPHSINCEEHYALFSKQIESLLETKNYSDMIIQCGEESFEVHKCVLSSRSPEFKRYIQVLEDGITMAIPDVDPRDMRVVLVYIYSGVLKNPENRDILKIYDIAKNLAIECLKIKCSEILVSNLQLQNVLEILFLADNHKDSKLKTASFNFIMRNIKEVTEQDCWESLRHEKLILYEELQNYAKNYIKCNTNYQPELANFIASDSEEV